MILDMHNGCKTYRHTPEHSPDRRSFVPDVRILSFIRRERCEGRPVPQDIRILLARQLSNYFILPLKQSPNPSRLRDLSCIRSEVREWASSFTIAIALFSLMVAINLIVPVIFVIVGVVRAGIRGGLLLG